LQIIPPKFNIHRHRCQYATVGADEFAIVRKFGTGLHARVRGCGVKGVKLRIWSHRLL